MEVAHVRRFATNRQASSKVGQYDIACCLCVLFPFDYVIFPGKLSGIPCGLTNDIISSGFDVTDIDRPLFKIGVIFKTRIMRTGCEDKKSGWDKVLFDVPAY